MKLWFFSAAPSRGIPSARPTLEALEDRCLPSANPLADMPQPSMAANAIAALPHEQIHVLQDQFHQQTQMATIRLEVEQIALGLLQPFAPRVPQVQPLIAGLTAAIPTQQAAVQMLQNQSNLLDQLDDLQDQALILNAVIQNGSPLIPLLQRFGNEQAAINLENTLVADQMTVQALAPQIAAVEQEVSTFV